MRADFPRTCDLWHRLLDRAESLHVRKGCVGEIDANANFDVFPGDGGPALRRVAFDQQPS